MLTEAVLRGATGPAGSRLARLLGEGLEPVVPLRAVSGPFTRVVADLTVADAPALAAAGEAIPDGAARPEAVAVGLREEGASFRWDTPVVLPDLEALLDLCRERGRSSVRIWRACPGLLGGLQLGAWFDAPWRTRLLRRRAAARAAVRRSALSSTRMLTAAADAAFWMGARDEADDAEWERLTRSSYAVLVYHRFAGELKPGQERIDIAPRRFARQLRALRLARFRPLPIDRALAFHQGGPPPGRRSVAITVDDAIADSIGPLERHSDLAPALFIPTAELGGAAHWIDGEPVAGWEQVRGLAAAGVSVGSHTRHHSRLTGLGDAERREELEGSLADLREKLPAHADAVAYPNGDHDPGVCAAARAAGYLLGFTTEKGRNGAGTDPYCLRRVSVHGADGALAVLWKAATGEGLPRTWLRLRSLFGRAQPG